MRFVADYDQPAPLHPVFSQQRASWCVSECMDPDVVYEDDNSASYLYDGASLPIGIGRGSSAYAAVSPMPGARMPAVSASGPQDSHAAANPPAYSQAPHQRKPHRLPPHQPGLNSASQQYISRSTSMPGLMPRGVSSLPRGLGANGASAFTMQSAQRLDGQLAAGGNAGCSDSASALRQLTFTFKAACLTDPAIQNAVNLNMSTALAMTGYGPGSDAALTYVLGASRTYQGGAVTDDAGHCLAVNMPTPVVPPVLAGPAAAVVAQIMAALANVPLAQQQQVVNNLTNILATFLAQLAAANIGQVATPLPTTLPSTTTTTETITTKPAGMSTTEKVIVGGVVGAVVLGAAVLITRHMSKKGH